MTRSRTVRVYRRLSAGLTALCALLALVGLAGGARVARATEDLDTSTGPVLVATQSLRASLAAADAAATAAYLTAADEDPAQRRTYLDALRVANGQLADIAAHLGESPDGIAAITAVGVEMTRYAGLVEAARAARQAGVDAADEYLVAAVEQLDGDLAEAVATLTEQTRAQLSSDLDARTTGAWVAAVVAVVALAGLAAAQLDMARRSHRLVNVPLALATLLVAGTLVWIAVAVGSSNRRIDAAIDLGYEQIEVTAAVQAKAFTAQAQQTVALITGSAAAANLADAARIEVSGEQHLGAVTQRADSAREQQLADEAELRWRRYTEAIATLRAAGRGEEARAIAVGPVATTFNGFVFALEGVLADNRDQLLFNLDHASGRLASLPALLLVLPLLAAGLTTSGFRLRLSEYR